MTREEAILYLEHTTSDDFNLEEHQIQNRLNAIQFLLEENQELKSQLAGTTHCFDEEEHEKLKKEVEEYKDKINWYENFEVNKTIDKLRIKHNNQQKEFIKYLEKTIEELECDDVDDEEMKGYIIQRIDTFKEILSKYKEIIGISDENNMGKSK